MFCQNCGSQIPDGTAYCPTCGAATGQPQQPRQVRQPQQPKKDNTVRIVLIALAAVLFIAAVVLTIVLVTRDSGSSGGSKSSSKSSSSKNEENEENEEDEEDTGDSSDSAIQSALENYVKNVFALDAKKLIGNVPDAEIEAYAEGEDISKSEAKQEMKDELQDLLDEIAEEYDLYDPDYVSKVSVEVRDQGNWNDKVLRDYNEDLEDNYGVALNVKEAATVEIMVSVKYDGDTYKYILSDINVFKIDGSWYVYSLYVEDIFEGLNTAMS